MKMVKSLLLGSAAGLVAVAGAQAADLPVKAKPVQYVKICSLYGAGFYYIPGTDTCIKVGGYMRAEVDVNAGGSFSVPAVLNLNNRNAFFQDWRTRAALTVDTRSQTEYGTLRSYWFISATDDDSGFVNSGNGAPGNGTASGAYNRIYAPAGFIQWAGFTVGKTDSFFDFDTQPYTNSSAYWSTANGGNGYEQFAYTAQFGNGISASLALQNADATRLGIANGPVAATTGTFGATQPYANQGWPDVVANVRIDQAWGGAQIAGELHQVRAQDTGGVYGVLGNHPGDATGWALGGGLKFNLPMLGKGDYVMGSVNYSTGIIDNVGANEGATASGGQIVTKGYPVTSAAVGVLADAVIVPGNTLDLTKTFVITAGYEHFWNPQWKTSLWGDYGQVHFDAAASAVLFPAGGSASWSLWQMGSRTTWTPVQNLDLSVEVMYNSMRGAGYAGAVSGLTASNENWVSGIFRVQRNFWP